LNGFPLNYKEPQGFTSVGDQFKAYKCYGCTGLRNIGVSNTVPPYLLHVGHAFEAFEYYGCEKLLVLPDWYKETPQLISDNLYDYQLCKFAGCHSLRTLPDGYHETDVVSVGDNYLAYKFTGSGLEFLPPRYTESPALTFVGNNCQVGKFKECTRLMGLPVNYREVNPVSIGNNFLKWKFKNCDMTVNSTYQLPNVDRNQQGVFEEMFAKR